jgi:hypothetical protein
MNVVTESRNLWSTFAYPVNRRIFPRVSLAISMKLKGRGSLFFIRQVKTVNVSREGVCVILPEEIEAGQIVGVSAFKGKFIASALITNVRPFESSGWLVGLKFVEWKGKWVII